MQTRSGARELHICISAHIEKWIRKMDDGWCDLTLLATDDHVMFMHSTVSSRLFGTSARHSSLH